MALLAKFGSLPLSLKVIAGASLFLFALALLNLVRGDQHVASSLIAATVVFGSGFFIFLNRHQKSVR